MGVASVRNIQPFQNQEDGEDYQVWKVTTNDRTLVLKKAKEQEMAVYRDFFTGEVPGVPKFYAAAQAEDADYFLMEYVSGQDLCKCDRAGLKKALDALIGLQDRFWEDPAYSNGGYTFAESLAGREKRGQYLNDTELERAYGTFLELYRSVPRTLCHDDLLPFNVLVSEDGATLIDWEYGGMLPYPTSLARLIAHGVEEEQAFFYMKDEDRAFAIDYYYEHLVCKKGISYTNYRRTLDYFLLYEYCEWIMVGNRHGSTDTERYVYFVKKAKDHVRYMKNRWGSVR